MKHILLLGDSIRLSYQEKVKELLGPEYKVYHPADNCMYSKALLWGIWSWVGLAGQTRLDLIHWNAGIWDHHHFTKDGLVFAPLDEYVKNCLRICDETKAYSDRVVFATTTPGWPDLHPGWNEDIELYNQTVLPLMRAKGIIIIDLYTLIMPRLYDYISEDKVHLSPAGVDAVARQVSETIRQSLS